MQKRVDGAITYIDLSNTTDDGVPIYCLMRTPIYDGGANNQKHQTDLTIVGDQVTSQALVRWSDDDYRTFNNFKRVNLNSDRPHTTRGGSFRRRSYDLLHTSTVQARFTELEVELKR